MTVTAPIRNAMPSITAAVDLLGRRLVKLDGSQQLILNGAGEAPLGLTTDNDFSAGDAVSFEPMRSAGGIVPVVGSKGIVIGADIYPAANGKVSDTISGTKLGVGLTAITADGESLNIMLV